MDFSNTSATELGAALDRLGYTWEFDDDGDISFRVRSNSPAGYSAVNYTMVQDRSVAGQFLDAEVTFNPDGFATWDVPDDGPRITAVVQNVVTIVLAPRPGQLVVQVYASILPQGDAVPIRISIAPSEDQVEAIEGAYPGFVGRREHKNLCFQAAATASNIDDAALLDFTTYLDGIGRHMFTGSFEGWMQIPKL